MGKKIALLIGMSEYEDPNLASLMAPHIDVSTLADVLRAPSIGDFDEVIEIVDADFAFVYSGLADFFADRRSEDLLVLFFSGHGILDEQGRLYLAIRTTRLNRVSGTAISASYIGEEMERSFSKRQVLILDCCHSGAFPRGMKGELGVKAVKESTFNAGFGKVVLTATDSTQYAWEGEHIIGQAENSLFTHFLIEGLRTGDADINRDGHVSVDELYDYLYQQVRKSTANQTPTKFSHREQGEIIIARNPNGITDSLGNLPIELQQGLKSSLPKIREAAVIELGVYLERENYPFHASSYSLLSSLTNDGNAFVAAAASRVLLGYKQKVEPQVGDSTPANVDSLTVQTSESFAISSPINIDLTQVPAGEFILGNDAFEAERPEHRVFVSEFKVSRYPISIKQFSAFVAATDYKINSLWNYLQHPWAPVVNVDWELAEAFCKWLSGESGRIFRLPTEAEWEKVAKTRTISVLRLDDWENPGKITAPVFGDWLVEWCLDWYGEREYLGKNLSTNPAKNPSGPKTGFRRVGRGGTNAFRSNPMRISYRSGYFPLFWYRNVTFRVVQVEA